MEKQFNYVYRIVNNLNGMEYVGVHSTNNMDDNYFGSGKYLKNAIKKHGRNNFSKTVLELFSTREAALNYERHLADIEYISREDTYNLIIGGGNGIITVDSKRLFFSKKESKGFKYNIDIPKDKQRYFRTNLTYDEIIKNYIISLNTDNKEIERIYNQMMALNSVHVAKSLTVMWNDQRFHKKAVRYFYDYKAKGFFNNDLPIFVYQDSKVE